MRCSGWSSLATSACSAALVLAAPAGAHVTAVTPFVYASETGALELRVPNERDAPMTGFVVIVTDDFRIVSASSGGGWSGGSDGTTASWHDGSLDAGAETTFTLEVEAPSEPGPASFRTEQHYPDGQIVGWDVGLTVVPARGSAPSENLGLAVITALVGLLVLTVFGVLLWRRRTAALR